MSMPPGASAKTKAFVLLGALSLAVGARAQQSTELETIDVIGTPLGSKLDTDRVAANVQTATAKDLRERGALDLADFMKLSLGSVFVNDVQSNPLQPDVQYRGFVGSPLLGLSQGLAIYQDGVRLNEPFGDTVNWALIPESAIDVVYLLPGSNPLFGLNALGGAIAIETKDGFSTPGTRGELLAGSFGRKNLQLETGGMVGDRLGYFVTASHLAEDGWRDFSPTEATQLFATLGAQHDESSVDVRFTFADTDLVGNGAAPAQLLALDGRAIFTHPDRTENRMAMLNVMGEQAVSAGLLLIGNLYVRHSDARTLNGDDSDFEECTATPGWICLIEEGDETPALDDRGEPIPANDALQGATINRTRTNQDSLGFGLQANFTADLAQHENGLTIGLAHDQSNVAFFASTELGSLDATRLAVPGGALVGDRFTDLEASIENTGIFVTDTLSFGERTALTVSARYNRAAVLLDDQLGTELSGAHAFTRLNPAIAVTTRLGDGPAFYASYSEANRAPSPVELTCADENDPCRLPNAFVADPPLEQVVAKTLEAGLRGQRAEQRWHVGVFRTNNDDDILFISAGALTNEGYFDNVGETRRDGLEINLAGGIGERLDWSFDYTLLEATFRETFTVASPNHPGQIDGEIMVMAGDRLPLIPERLLKMGLRFAATGALSVGADLLAASGQHYRGDEANLLETLGAYSVLNLRAEYRFSDRASVFANIDNVLDQRYETFGVLGDARSVLGEAFDDARFIGPGAPRAAWLGIRVEL